MGVRHPGRSTMNGFVILCDTGAIDLTLALVETRQQAVEFGLGLTQQGVEAIGKRLGLENMAPVTRAACVEFRSGLPVEAGPLKVPHLEAQQTPEPARQGEKGDRPGDAPLRLPVPPIARGELQI